jgi:hypothetical protein
MATVRNLLTRQQSSKYYYQVRESSNSISCLKFHIEKKCRGMINLDNRKFLLKNTGKPSMNDEYTHSTQSPLEGPKYIKNICTKKKRQNILLTNTINETKRCKSDG